MPDDKSRRGEPDRRRVAAKEQYQVVYYAKKHGLSLAEAHRITEEAGPSRGRAVEAATLTVSGTRFGPL